MTALPQPEPWMRGPLPGVPALLQPVAHALVSCREEVGVRLAALPVDELWATPGGGAAAGFHVVHAAGALDRLFTYARGEQLSAAQLAALDAERTLGPETGDAARIVERFTDQIERALAQARVTSEATLLEPREVGRGRLPSTVLGLLFHAAEHTQRHVGQATSTLRIVRGLRALTPAPAAASPRSP